MSDQILDLKLSVISFYRKVAENITAETEIAFEERCAEQFLRQFLVCYCFKISNATLERPWFRANDSAEQNEKARKMYESLMTVTLRKPDSERYRLFSDEVKQKAFERYGDSVYGDDEVSVSVTEKYFLNNLKVF